VSLINSLRSGVGWISRRNVAARELIKSAKLQRCPAASIGQATDMPLLDAMRAGFTYVNVHTNDGVGVTTRVRGIFLEERYARQLD
jgi:hypothetical protein